MFALNRCMFTYNHNNIANVYNIIGNDHEETQNIQPTMTRVTTPMDVVTSIYSELDVLIQLRLFEIQACLEWVVS